MDTEYPASSKKKDAKNKINKLKIKAERRGILYISRIPPGCSANKIRALLEAHGEVDRMHLAEEDNYMYVEESHSRTFGSL